jgi:hypothetical protein
VYSVSTVFRLIQYESIIHDVWRLLILSNEEKGMIMKFLKKGWLWKFWKKGGGGGGSREKGEGGNEIHAPCACDKKEFICIWGRGYLRIIPCFTWSAVGQITVTFNSFNAYVYMPFYFLSPMLSYFPVFFVVTGLCVDKSSPDR